MIPPLFLVELSFFGFLFLFFGRLLIYKILKSIGVKSYNHVNAIIIADTFSLPVIENLLSKKELGYKIEVIFTDSELIKNKFENHILILPEKFLEIINDLIMADFVDELFYLKEKPDAPEVRQLLRSCENLGVTLMLKSKEPDISISSAVKMDLADSKFLSFLNISNNTYSRAIKKTLDINLALLIIVVLFPVLIFISLLIKLTSRGPVVTNFLKTGLQGQQIDVYRFRTMLITEDQKSIYPKSSLKISYPESEIGKDSRFTKLGRFLNKSGLDQLPQLFNVLKGELPFIAQRHPLQSESIKQSTGIKEY
jgi:lipopolysaccharide/colanic/teichoic acid biosynthesis glycosyltransferase